VKLDKAKGINGVLWLAFVLAMAASISHLAWTFGTVERPGWEALGWIPAVAVDAGLAALAYTIQQRKRANKRTAGLWVGVVGFAVVSALANLYHALAVEAVANPVIHSLITSLVIQGAKALVLSATLPIMYIFLGEIVSGDDATAAERERRQAERASAQAEREQRRADLQAEREAAEAKARLLEAEIEAKRLAEPPAEQPQSEQESEPEQVVCADCGRSFRSINARNAHKCESKNGKVEVQR
jgi:signal transduction histidine kinase